MGRINFYHTVWRKNPVTGAIQPLADIQITVHKIVNGTEDSGTTVAFADRTGIGLADMETDDRGEIDFWLDPGDYMVHFTDPSLPQRIADFEVGVSGVSGDNEGILLEQLKLAVQQGIHLPGDLKCVAYATPDTGWFLCDGSPKSRTTYADLFAKIGTTYNSGGETGSQFGVPDLRGRVPVGVDGAAARLTASDALGNAAGAEKITLAEADIPAHLHAVSLVSGNENSSLSHSHPPTPLVGGTFGNPTGFALFENGVNAIMNIGTGGPYWIPALSASRTGSDGPPVHQHNVSGNTGNKGDGGAHNNMPPFQIFNWMIKY